MDCRAFYIAEDEVDTLLEKTVGSPVWAEVALPPDLHNSLQARLDEMAAGINERVAESMRQGIDLRLLTLAGSFGLSTFDLDVILICLASEIDRRYERLYAYLQDDVTRKHPSVALVLDLYARRWKPRSRSASAWHLLRRYVTTGCCTYSTIPTCVNPRYWGHTCNSIRASPIIC